MIRQRLCIKHTQIKAREPKLSGGCKSMNRLKNRDRNLGGSVNDFEGIEQP